MKPAKTENPYVVVPEDNLTKVLDLLDDIAKERKDIIELLSKAQGLDVASLQQAVASHAQIHPRVNEPKPPHHLAPPN